MNTETMTTAAANQRRGSASVVVTARVVDGAELRRLTYLGVTQHGLTRAMTWGVGPRVMRRLPDEWKPRPYTRIKLEPCSEVIGAEVRDVDLAVPLDDALRDEIRDALLEWKVLFFREQHLTPEQHLAFARAFGELE